MFIEHVSGTVLARATVGPVHAEHIAPWISTVEAAHLGELMEGSFVPSGRSVAGCYWHLNSLQDGDCVRSGAVCLVPDTVDVGSLPVGQVPIVKMAAFTTPIVGRRSSSPL